MNARRKTLPAVSPISAGCSVRTGDSVLSTQYLVLCSRPLLRSSRYAPRLRGGFTLFELILAIALSATLLALVGTAINLYLLRVDASRTRVEEAQLARSVLAMIAADIRATTPYQTQDISSVSQLASAAAQIDVDDIDAATPFSGSAIGDSSTAGGSTPTVSAGVSSTGESTTTMLPGLNGTLNELYLDVSRLPRLDELFAATPAPTAGAAPAVAPSKPSDAKTVRYFVRQGVAIDPGDIATTSLAPAEQLRAGGLVRQTLDQAVRTAAEQTGNTALLESGQVLLAPEVTAVEFRFFDGASVYSEWNMQEMQALPPAVEVRVWMTSADETSGSATAAASSGVAMPGTRMYSRTVELPLASATSSTASTSTDTESSSTTGSQTDTGGLQ